MITKLTNSFRPDPLTGLLWVIATSVGLMVLDRESALLFGACQFLLGILFIRPSLSKLISTFAAFLFPALLLSSFHAISEQSLWENFLRGGVPVTNMLASNTVYYSSRLFLGASVALIYVRSYSSTEISWAFSKVGVPASICIAMQISLSALPIFVARFGERYRLFLQRDRIRGKGNKIGRCIETIQLLPFDALHAADAVSVSVSARGFNARNSKHYISPQTYNPLGNILLLLSLLVIITF